jgi:hypothetical protein
MPRATGARSWRFSEGLAWPQFAQNRHVVQLSCCSLMIVGRGGEGKLWRPAAWAEANCNCGTPDFADERGSVGAGAEAVPYPRKSA